VVASLAPVLRTASIARLTSAISASDVSGVGACARGTFEGEMRRTGGAAATCGAASVPLDAPGRARGIGTSSAAAFLDDLSLCLATFLPALVAGLAAVRDELTPLWEAAASAAAE